MKRILALSALCLMLCSCGPGAAIPTHTVHTIPPSTVETTAPWIPETTSPATVETVQETVPETIPETVPPTIPETVPEAVPEVTEPGPQTVYADPEELSLTASQAFVYDCASGDLWVWGDQHAQIAPASLVKLFTIHTALQYLSEDQVITAGNEVYLVGEGASVAAISRGDRLTVAMLAEGCLVQSGNDAAYVLATAAGRKILNDPDVTVSDALAAFLAQMNESAQQLGLTDTRFVNPDGFDAPGQHSSPADLLTIARLSLENPLILRYCGISRDHVQFESGEDYIWYSTNFLLHPSLKYYRSEAFGLKTGTTSQAGAHLIAAFHAPDRDLIIGVFGCPNKTVRFEEAALLFELAK